MRRLPHAALRCLLLAAGLTVMAFGVAFSIKAELGTSPISSLPYVLSRITPLSVGTATIALHITLILLQILLLRRDYQPLQLLQLPVALLFGVLTDIAIAALATLSCSSYAARWVFCAIGILLVGLGVSLEVLAGLVTLAGEGMVLAICQAFSSRFTRVKVGFDLSLVLIASLLSLLFLGRLAGVREGTAAAALCVGLCARGCSRLLQPLARFLRR